jgi:hypothetical protein
VQLAAWNVVCAWNRPKPSDTEMALQVLLAASPRFEPFQLQVLAERSVFY